MATGEAISKTFLHIEGQAANPPQAKKKRNLPGTPDPEAEVIALSPKSLLATNRFLCEICGKGFQRDQNLQLHRRGHNLPWKLRQRSTKEPRKKVYVCPEKGCIHHHPSRALGDLTGIKKHFCRKHGEKKWKCDKCSKRYAVRSDWNAHSKTCGTREYRCDCGTLFSRRDSFITHRAFCDALAEESARISATSNISTLSSTGEGSHHAFNGDVSLLKLNMAQHHLISSIFKPVVMANGEVVDQGASDDLSLWMGHGSQNNEAISNHNSLSADLHVLGDPFSSCSNTLQQHECNNLSWMYGNKIPFSSTNDLTSTELPTNGASNDLLRSVPSLYSNQHQAQSRPLPDMSATALLQKAAQLGVATSADPSFLGEFNPMFNSNPILGVTTGFASTMDNSSSDVSTLEQLEMYSTTTHREFRKRDLGGGKTRDFLGVGIPTTCPPSIHGWI